jgi:mono/diheme cytochrome c family protein
MEIRSRITPFIRTHWLEILASAVIISGAGTAAFIYDRLFRDEPAPYFESDEDHFLFGSVGTETSDGVPYWIWLVLPRIFPDLLPGPGGYASLGIVAKPGYEMPVGLSKVTSGFPRVGINCAMCHTASVRLRPDDIPMIVAGAPSHQVAPQAYVRFLIDAAADPRFTAGSILGEIARNYRLSAIDRLLYRFVIIPRTRRTLLRLGEQTAWMRDRPDWGKGRGDAFNPAKFRILRQPLDDTVGHTDMTPLWTLNAHGSYAYHWDGLNTDLREVVMASAIGGGANLAWVDRDYARWDSADPRERSSLRRVMNYISELQPPKFPFDVDQPLAAGGAEIYRGQCASCHAPGSPRFGQVVPAAEVGTDRRRLEMWTKESAAAYNAYGEGREWAFSGFRTTDGYVAVSLDGLWLRAPYLHNGSVPSLADLLEPPETRPTQFWRGYDLFDPVKIGFISDGPEARRIGTPYDISLPGNSNAGHAYGTTLAPESKRALLEYLKTL